MNKSKLSFEEREENERDNRSEAWAVAFLCMLFKLNRLNDVNINDYLPRIKSTLNRKMIDAMLGKNKEEHILARLKRLTGRIK